MNFRPTSIPDVILIEPRVYEDERGFFLETFRVDQFISAGISAQFVQENFSGSLHGILRGLHYQIQHAQGKLVRAARGEIFDVAVDLRRSSATFQKWIGLHLTAENRQQVWIPPGFAHGFLVLSEWAEVIYKTTDYYAPQWERTLLWNDPDLAIDWPLQNGKTPTLSSKDKIGALMRQAELFD